MQRFIFLLLVCSWASIYCLPVTAADQNPQSVQSVEQQTPEASSKTTSPQQSTPQQSASPLFLLEEDYWIDPDRPHVADSSVNVPKGLWLQENGFQQSFANRHSAVFDFPETLIRLGVTDRTEIRYNVPNFFASSITTVEPDLTAVRLRSASFQNMQAGFKHRLHPGTDEIPNIRQPIYLDPYRIQ